MDKWSKRLLEVFLSLIKFDAALFCNCLVLLPGMVIYQQHLSLQYSRDTDATFLCSLLAICLDMLTDYCTPICPSLCGQSYPVVVLMGGS